MQRILKFGMLACCAALVWLLVTPHAGPYVSLFIAPAIGLLASFQLIILALGAVIQPSRAGGDA